MKQDRANIPPLIVDMVKNSFDAQNRPVIRDNYYRTLVSIRDYLNEALVLYEKQKNSKQKRA